MVQRIRALDAGDLGGLDAYGLGDDDEREGAHPESQFRLHGPDLALHQRPAAHQQARVGGQHGVHSIESLGSHRGRMTDDQFAAARDSLSDDQRACFDKIRQHVQSMQHSTAEDRPDPLHLFVTGGAGSGKSFLNEFVHEFLTRAHTGFAGTPAVLTAPTGAAAFNIKGNTLHRACNLRVDHCRAAGDARVTYKPMQARQLQEMRVLWSGVRYLITDEISMVSIETLSFVDRWEHMYALCFISCAFSLLPGFVLPTS